MIPIINITVQPIRADGRELSTQQLRTAMEKAAQALQDSGFEIELNQGRKNHRKVGVKNRVLRAVVGLHLARLKV